MNIMNIDKIQEAVNTKEINRKKGTQMRKRNTS